MSSVSLSAEAAKPRRKKSLEIDVRVDAEIREIAEFMYIPQASLINQILRDYADAHIDEVRRRRRVER